MHWPPRIGDEVWDSMREKYGRVSYGQIISVDRDWHDQDNSEVMVYFPGGNIIRGIGWISSNGIKYPEISEVRHPETFAQDATNYETYSFSELAGNWSSHSDGDGLWSLG